MVKFYCCLYFKESKRFANQEDFDLNGKKVWMTDVQLSREEAQLEAIYAYQKIIKINFSQFGLKIPIVELVTFNSETKEVGRTRLEC